MGKKRKNAGFSMAELLIVVAIIAVLGALAFVVIVDQMRSMAKVQRDAYAKEIFIAAQNHLAMAKSQGYLGEGSSCGTEETTRLDSDIVYQNPEGKDVTIKRDGVYFYEVHAKPADEVGEVASNGILNLMLPFGSIDDTLRVGGSYIIRYHKDAGEVLDVFYWEKEGRYSLTYEDSDYADFLEHREDKSYMRNYRNGAVVGWYGGEDVGKLGFGAKLNKPRVSVKNVEKLYVTVKDTNAGVGDLKLLITGNTSGACKEVVLKSSSMLFDPSTNTIPVTLLTDDRYQVVLDDITSVNGHFYYQFCREACRGKDLNDMTEHWFIPGEDVSIQAVAFNSEELTNVAYGSKWTTNSLFASVKADNTKKYTASITNIRHLENTDVKVSNLVYFDSGEAVPVNMEFKHAKQQADLSWTDFKRKIAAEDLYIYPYSMETGAEESPEIALTKTANCFYPVTLDMIDDYNGTNHSVFGVQVDHTDTYGLGLDGTSEPIGEGAGLFGTLRGSVNPDDGKLVKKEVFNLRLVDFTVRGNGSAGTLAGIIEDAEVENVVAFSSDGGYILVDGSLDNVVVGATNAGGLIGTAKNSTVTKSAAAMIVRADGNGESTGNAGGLIGLTEEDTSVIACYSGGHTLEADYTKQLKKDANGVVITDPEDEEKTFVEYNVTATNENGTAGGLVGRANAAEISYSYSTCSVFGKTAGGLAGEANGEISHCYATGLVTDEEDASDPSEGAFIGTYDRGADGAIDFSALTDCNYFEAINGRRDATGDYKYLQAIGGDFSKAVLAQMREKVKGFDWSVESYEAFVGDQNAEAGDDVKDWRTAIPYDRYLVNYYSGLYNLRTVEQLVPEDELAAEDDEDGIRFEDEDFVQFHFGDWPAPEVIVVNE